MLSGQKEIALTTSDQTPGTVYTLNVTGVRDRAPAGNSTLPGASATFTGYVPPVILANIPETSGYRLVYQLAIPGSTPQYNTNAIPYTVNEGRYGEEIFDRVAYLLELDGTWAYVSFDRHTPWLSKAGLTPLTVTSTPFQQIVSNMNVSSNVPGIVTGTGLTTGNIEFWGGNYEVTNALNIPNASATTFDFGDKMTSGGHGCFQVHNHGAGQTIFAYDNWGGNSGQPSSLGIGNNPNAGVAGQGGSLQGPDWTFAPNGANFTTRNLYVLIRPGGSPGGEAPVFYSHPASRAANVGGSVGLAVTVAGTGPFTYQWRHDNTPMPGQTNPWLDLANLGTGDAGNYDVVVTGPTFVTATSLTGVITVNSPPTFDGYSFGAVTSQPTTVLADKILAHAADVDNDTLSISAVSAASAQGGTVSLVAGGVLYTSAAAFTGTDHFTVTITDGHGNSVNGTLQVTVSDGSNPTANQASLVKNGDGTVDVLFYGIPGRSYQIQRSTDLLIWTIQQTLNAAADGKLPFHDPAPPEDTAFYRTRETP